MPTDTEGLRAEKGRREQEINEIDKKLKGGFWSGAPSKQDADQLINQRTQLLEEVKAIDRQIKEESSQTLPRIGNRKEEGML